MNQRSSKLVKIILCCVMGMLFFTGCSSTDTPTDPVVVEPSEPVDERSQIEILAEEYDHLAVSINFIFSNVIFLVFVSNKKVI